MKKVRKGKKMLMTMIIAVIAIILAIVIIVNIVKHNKEKQGTGTEDKQQVFELPETKTDSGMDVQKISMEYLKDNNQTMVTMRITNTTGKKVKEENFKAILVGPSDNVLGSMPTGTSVDLDVGEQCEVTVVYSGDLTATQRIKLEKMQ